MSGQIPKTVFGTGFVKEYNVNMLDFNELYSLISSRINLSGFVPSTTINQTGSMDSVWYVQQGASSLKLNDHVVDYEPFILSDRPKFATCLHRFPDHAQTDSIMISAWYGEDFQTTFSAPNSDGNYAISNCYAVDDTHLGNPTKVRFSMYANGHIGLIWMLTEKWNPATSLWFIERLFLATSTERPLSDSTEDLVSRYGILEAYNADNVLYFSTPWMAISNGTVLTKMYQKTFNVNSDGTAPMGVKVDGRAFDPRNIVNLNIVPYNSNSDSIIISQGKLLNVYLGIGDWGYKEVYGGVFMNTGGPTSNSHKSFSNIIIPIPESGLEVL